jgi:hypothetical protein
MKIAHTAGIPRLDRAYRAAVALALLAFAVPLVVFAYTGTTARLWADDYCYDAVLRADGFWKAQETFYRFTSDRYSVIPLVGIGDALWEGAVRAWPAAVIALALLGAERLLAAVARVYSTPRSVGSGLGAQPAVIQPGLGVRLLLCGMALFFILWQAPNLFQILYWRTGMLTYFMPLALLLFLAAHILRRGPASRFDWGGAVVAFVLAFIAGGFSETTAAMQAGAVGMGLLAALLVVVRMNRVDWTPALQRTAAAVLGTLLAMVALYVSPSNQLRLVHMPEPAGLSTLIGLSFRFGWDFIADTFSSQPLPTLVSLAAPFALGMAWFGRAPRGFSAISTALAGAGALLAAYLLIVCSVAPSVYVEVAYPEPRALIAARFAMTAGLATAGWLGARWLHQVFSQAARAQVGLALVGLVLLAAAALYPLRAARTLAFVDLPFYQARAAAWDARDLAIHQRIQQGERSIEIRALDSIAGLMEIHEDPGRFPNNCFAGAYGLDAVIGRIP